MKMSKDLKRKYEDVLDKEFKDFTDKDWKRFYKFLDENNKVGLTDEEIYEE